MALRRWWQAWRKPRSEEAAPQAPPVGDPAPVARDRGGDPFNGDRGRQG